MSNRKPTPPPENWMSWGDLMDHIDKIKKPRICNLKPSKLPEGTVIDDDRHGEFIKRADGVWEETSCDYMGDRERVADISFMDSGMGHREWYKRYPMVERRPSDEYFESFKIIAVPPGFVFVGEAESIHGNFSAKTMSYADGTVVHDCKGYNCEH